MKIYASFGAPPVIKGLVRDIRPVWALEEIGADYEIHWLNANAGEQKADAYRTINPFGKVPAMEDGDVTLFESGAICLYIADKYKALGGPAGNPPWNEVLQWSFAALDTVMPPLFDHFIWANFRADHQASQAVDEMSVTAAKARFEVLDPLLGKQEFIAGEDFTVADVLMGSALRNALKPDITGGFPSLQGYMERLYDRPAFKRAFEINMAGPAA